MLCRAQAFWPCFSGRGQMRMTGAAFPSSAPGRTPVQWGRAGITTETETLASCPTFWSSALFLQVCTFWPTQQEGGFSLCLKRKKCPRVCRDALQFSPAEADRMRLWAVPLRSMLPLFKMKRKPRKGRTTRMETCLVVSAIEFHPWPLHPGLSREQLQCSCVLFAEGRGGVQGWWGCVGRGLMRDDKNQGRSFTLDSFHHNLYLEDFEEDHGGFMQSSHLNQALKN